MKEASAIMAILTKEAASVAQEFADACLRAHEKLTVLQGFEWEDEEDEQTNDASQDDDASEIDDASDDFDQLINDVPSSHAHASESDSDAQPATRDAGQSSHMVAQSDSEVYSPTIVARKQRFDEDQEPSTRVRSTKKQLAEMDHKILQVLRNNPRGMTRSEVHEFFDDEVSLNVTTRRLVILNEERKITSQKDGREKMYFPVKR